MWHERVWKWGGSAVEWLRRSTLRWFGHIGRMENEEFVKKGYYNMEIEMSDYLRKYDT